MDDDKLKQLFGNFNPPLSSDHEFVSRLETRLESVEMIRRHNLSIQKRNERSVSDKSTWTLAHPFYLTESTN